jgi:hypothetical protein
MNAPSPLGFEKIGPSFGPICERGSPRARLQVSHRETILSIASVCFGGEMQTAHHNLMFFCRPQMILSASAGKD